MSQSKGLSKRIIDLAKSGRKLNDDSSLSEKTLTKALHELIPYIEAKCKSIGGTLKHHNSMSLFQCQEYFHTHGGPLPNEDNKKVYMKPDGGIFIMTLKGKGEIPLLIIEDKVQGTNDTRYQEKKNKQSTGNAIERAGKNMRGAEMIFAGQKIYPYVIFASGCDFHHTETIAKRIEMMNYGFPNHYIPLLPSTSQTEVDEKINTILPTININKINGKCIASVFIKSHKWDEMKHGSSLWKKEEIVVICKKVIDKVFETIIPSLIQDT